MEMSLLSKWEWLVLGTGTKTKWRVRPCWFSVGEEKTQGEEPPGNTSCTNHEDMSVPFRDGKNLGSK